MAPPLAQHLCRLRRRNLALATLLVLLGYGVYGVERAQRPPPPVTLTDLDPSAITSAQIRTDYGTIELEKRDQEWRLVAPIQGPVAELRSQALLALATTPVRASLPYDAARAVEFGLDTPPMRVRLGERLEVVFGAEAPLDGGRYVRVGERVQLINLRFYYYLNGTAEGFLATPAGG